MNLSTLNQSLITPTDLVSPHSNTGEFSYPTTTPYEYKLLMVTLVLCYMGLTDFGKYQAFPSNPELSVSKQLHHVAHASGPIIAYCLLLLHSNVPFISQYYSWIQTLGLIQVILMIFTAIMIAQRVGSVGPFRIQMEESLVVAVAIITSHAFYIWYTWVDMSMYYHRWAGLVLILIHLVNITIARNYESSHMTTYLENKDQLFELKQRINGFGVQLNQTWIDTKEKLAHDRVYAVVNEKIHGGYISSEECVSIIQSIRDIRRVPDLIRPDIKETMDQVEQETQDLVKKIEDIQRQIQTARHQNTSYAARPEILQIQTLMDVFIETCTQKFDTAQEDQTGLYLEPIINQVQSSTSKIDDAIELLTVATTPKDQEKSGMLKVLRASGLVFDILWNIVMGTAFYAYDDSWKSTMMYLTMYHCIRIVPMTRWTLRSMMNGGWEGWIVEMYTELGLTADSYTYRAYAKIKNRIDPAPKNKKN